MSRFVLTAQLQLQAPNNVAQVVRQIQSQLNNVNVNVQVQGAAQAQRQLQQVTAQTQAATTAADRMGRAFAVSIRRFAAFSIATRAVGLFTSTLSDAIKTAIDFEREMVRVSQVTGESIGNLKFLTKAVTDLSTGLGVSSQDLLNTSQLLLQAGISAKDTEVALKTLAKAALAPNFDSLSETTEGAIAILAQFQEGVGALEKQLGAINAVAGAFAVEAGDLIDVIRRAGGVFKSSGGDLNELIALFTSVRATTRESAESIGTGLRTIFTRIQRPKTIEFLKQFGVELVDLEGKFVGPFEAVKRLSTALSGLGEGDITFIRIAEELGGFRQIGKVLPLLQQFSTAQAALNVANKAGNSLTQDAATAQQALAIRILKVKEEFLALVRSMTETSTFQIMANTALSLASALIKIGEAIKPLLPMLAAVAAVNFARGISTFAGGMMRGMQSGRTYSTGGKVHHFARGGMVPGTGNRDTVPAMLQPGEFVIKKSSVNKLGASNLAAMNENRYAQGTDKDGAKMSTAAIIAAARADTNATGSKKLSKDIKSIPIKMPKFGTESEVGIATTSYLPSPARGNITVDRADIINQSIGDLGFKLSTKYGKNALSFINQVYKGKPKLSYNTIAEGVGLDEEAKFKTIIDESIGSSVDIASSRFAKEVLGSTLSTPVPKLPSFYQTLDQGFRGQLFENVISAMSGKPLSGQDSRRPFDFTRGLGKFKSIYSNLGMNYVDAKITSGAAGLKSSGFGAEGISGLTSKILGQLAKEAIPAISLLERQAGGIGTLTTQGKKLEQSLSPTQRALRKGPGSLRAFASGGGVGTDTVPALLTPGEFVVNRSSAQSIGYGNLNRMNKVGKYAKGGVVQRFAAGGTVKGDSIYETMAAPNLTKFNSSITKVLTVFDKLSGGSLLKVAASLERFAGSIGNGTSDFSRFRGNLNRLDYIAPGFMKAFEENSKANKRNVLKQMQVAGVMDGYIAQLQNAGASQAQLKTVVDHYTKQLTTNTAQLKSGASLTGMSSSPSASIGSVAVSPRTATTQANNPFATMTGTMGKASGVSQNTNSVNANTKAQQSAAKSAMDVVNNNKMFAASMATSLIAGFLPAVDENSSAMLKMTHSLLGLVTTITSVGFALEAFGLKLNKGQIMDFLGGKGKGISGSIVNKTSAYARAGTSALGRGLSSVQIPGMPTFSKGLQSLGGQLTKLAPSVGKAAGSFMSLLGPLVAIAGSAFVATKAFEAAIEAVYNFEGRLKMAVEAGNVDKAKAVAGERASFQGANVVRGGGATAGAVLGFILGGPIGAAIGAGLGAAVGTLAANLLPEGVLDSLNVMFGGDTRASAIALAAAQAGAVKTQKELEKAQKTATNAMQDFENGSINASEALSRIRTATAEVTKQEKRASDFAISNLENRASDGFTGRNIASTLTFGMVESSSARNQRLGQQSSEQIRQSARFQNEAFQMESGARAATIRSGFARGRSRSEIEAEATGNLRNRRTELLQNAQKALRAGDEQSANAFNEAAEQLRGQIEQVEREMANLEKEVARAKAAFDAMNLGLRGPTATATAMSASMDRFTAGLEVGGSTFVANTDFLSAAMSSAAQAMDPAEIKQAIDDVANNLSDMGANPAKFRANTEAFIQAQQNYNKAFEKIRSNIQARRERGQSPGDTPDEIKKAFASELTAGLGAEAKKNLTAIIENIPLSPEEVDKLLAGDLSVFGDKLSEAGKKQFEEIRQIAQERQKAEQVVIGLINKRADAERNLASAQKEAVDLYMEGRDVQAKYGGAAVTSGEKRAAIVARANAGAGNAGLQAMRTGSVAEIRARNAQIAGGIFGTETRRRTDGGMQGRAGAEADITQQNLQQAQKDQIDTIRSLIKLEEEELKIIQEKNKMEKDSLESLISGDIDKFFEQQAAVGAQAAIATGDMTLANQFGSKAVGDAFKDIQRQQEAGVQSLYGRQLAGPGGLTEQAAGAALASRGVMDPRMAQTLAGTTPEEAASQRRLQELGGVLGETGAWQQATAEMQVQTASINVSNAEVKLAQIEERGRQAAEGFARGGVVYANRGMFVPRGTDTVPAMLTPGEFVVRRESVNRGNNLQLLEAINNNTGSQGFARGGKVGYYNNGGRVQYKAGGGLLGSIGGALGIDPQLVTNLGNIFNTFVSGFNESIKNLQNTKLQVKLDSVNVNVNLNGTSMLTQISDQTRQEIMKQVVQKIQNEYSVGPGGKLTENRSNLPR